MKLFIDGESLRLQSAISKRALIINWRSEEGMEIISFELSDGSVVGSGKLPCIEFSRRETLLRHLGNRIEQVD